MARLRRSTATTSKEQPKKRKTIETDSEDESKDGFKERKSSSRENSPVNQSKRSKSLQGTPVKKTAHKPKTLNKPTAKRPHVSDDDNVVEILSLSDDEVETARSSTSKKTNKKTSVSKFEEESLHDDQDLPENEESKNESRRASENEDSDDYILKPQFVNHFAHFCETHQVKRTGMLMALDEIDQLIQQKGLTLNNTSLNSAIKAAHSSRTHSTSKKSSRSKKKEETFESVEEEDIPEGEWEVESIKDWIITPSGKLLFRVAWKYWTGDDTWEPLENVKNSWELVEEFLDSRYHSYKTEEGKKLIEKDARDLSRLFLILKRITSESDGSADLGIVIKLLLPFKEEVKKPMIDLLEEDSPSEDDEDSGGDDDSSFEEKKKEKMKKKEKEKQAEEKKAEVPFLPHEFSKTPDYLDILNCEWSKTPSLTKHNREKLYDALNKKCKELYMYFQPEKRFNATQVLGIVFQTLEIEKKFGSVEKFFHFCDERKKTLEKLNDLEKQINKSIKDLKDGPPTIFENLYDNELPAKFDFVKDYVYHPSIEIVDAVVKCDCHATAEDGKCGKKCPCIKENGRLPYNEQGTLLLDGRNAIYECNETCGCGPDCRFKVISRGRTHALGVFKTHDGRGYGLKALESIPKKKFVICYIGELIPKSERDSREKTQKEWMTTYMMDLDFNERGEAAFAVDARFKANLARFINHSCNPNLYINPSWSSNLDRDQPTIAFFSVRNIAKGEELFIDYNAGLQDVDLGDCDEEDIKESFICKCGADNCRGIIF